MYSERGLFIDGAWRRTGEAAENPVLDAREKGGAVVTGGSRPADRNAGLFFQPTVITGLPDDAKAGPRELRSNRGHHPVHDRRRGLRTGQR